LAAGGPVTFVATKVTKKASAERLLAHTAFALQSRQNHRLQKVAPLCSLQALASANICYAPAATQATKFCLLSSEAYLLTEKMKRII
jgi:hypothetical protein